ncbi:MAG: MFS transporter [Ktedonobacterales bacterium]|nr:MFS transporter [Ktedonobacterales bacterium]
MRSRDAGLWRHPDFLKLWVGQTISLLGSQVTMLALPFTAILVLKASAFQMGVLRAFQYVPALLIGLFAGAFVDRMRRRPILMAADLGRAAVLGSLPLAALLGALSMGYLYGVALLAGALTVLFEVAYLAYLPTLTSREHLVDANARLEASQSVASIAGPGLAGFLVQALSAPLAIAADAFSFLVSVGFLGLLRTPESLPVPPERRHLWREIGEGMRMALGHPLLRATLLSSGITNFFSAILNSLFVLYATRQLGINPAGIGSIFLLASVAGLAGALAAGRVARRLGVGPTIVLAELLIGVGAAIIVLAGGSLVLTIGIITGGLAVIAIGDSLYNINVVSLRQALIPDALLGRVSASLRFVIWGAQPFGALLGGVLGERFGLRATLGVVAAGYLCAFASLLVSPLRAVRTQPATGD